MRGLWTGACSLFLACAMFTVPSGFVRADNPEKELKKYNAIIHRHGQVEEEEAIFDLSRPDELHKLTELLTSGEVEELQKDKQVKLLDISWDLGLWSLVVFGLLLFVLRKLAWKPWLEGIQRRESNIKEALAEAQKARVETQQMRAELQKEMSGTEEKVRQAMDDARRDAQHAKDEMISQARAEIQSERERLQREIGMARDQALQELWTSTAQLATLISAKAIRRQLNVEDHRRLVDDAIAELRTVGKTPA